MTDWELEPIERMQLKAVVAHTQDARLMQRAYMLLWLDDDETVADVAAYWQVSRQTVYNWHERFSEHPDPALEARLADAERTRSVIAQPCGPLCCW